MRVNNVFSGRPTFFDRNPLMVNKQYSNVIGPATDTTRWTYTVPSGRKAVIESTLCFILRVTAAAPVGAFDDYINYTPSGGAASSITIATSGSNVVLTGDRNTSGLMGYLLAGDAVSGLTADASTGGTVQFIVSAKFTEFDA